MDEENKGKLNLGAYGSALDQLKGINETFNSITSQFKYLQSPTSTAILSNLHDIQPKLNKLNRISSCLPDIAKLIDTSPILEQSRQASLAISGLTAFSNRYDINHYVAANFAKTVAKSSLFTALGYDFSKTHALADTISKLVGKETLSALSIQNSITKSLNLAVFAEQSLFRINTVNIGIKLNLGNERKMVLGASVLDMTKSYSHLFKSFEQNPITYAKLDPTLLKIAPQEYFTTANLLETISVEEETSVDENSIQNEIQYENQISLEEYLPRVDPGLYKMWKGAIEAYNSNNTDRVRHFSTSIRELFTHLIHKLSPDESVTTWTTNPEYFHQNRPTRKARFMFICRNIDNEPFNQFVKKDVDAMLAFIEIFQKGTHDIDPVFTPAHLITIKSKAELTLKFLLEIHFSTNN